MEEEGKKRKEYGSRILIEDGIEGKRQEGKRGRMLEMEGRQR